MNVNRADPEGDDNRFAGGAAFGCRFTIRCERRIGGGLHGPFSDPLEGNKRETRWGTVGRCKCLKKNWIWLAALDDFRNWLVREAA